MIAHFLKKNDSLFHEKHFAHTHSWFVEFCTVDFLQVWECLDPAFRVFFSNLLLEKFNSLDPACHNSFLTFFLVSQWFWEKDSLCVNCVTDSRVNWNPQGKRDILMISSLSFMFILSPGVGLLHFLSHEKVQVLLNDIFPFSGLHFLSQICININQF